MYFESVESCEDSVRDVLGRTSGWPVVLGLLDSMCRQEADPEDARGRLEDALVSTLAEAVYDNSDEERPDPDDGGECVSDRPWCVLARYVRTA